MFLAPLIAAPRAVTAQGNPVATAVRTMAAESGKHLLAAAEAMPARKYAFKPTPAQMSFGELVAHVQRDNRTTCAALSDSTPAPEAILAATATKDELVSALQRSLTFCYAALARVEDARLADTVSWYGRKTSRATPLVGIVTDWADHYGQQAIYLRLSGVLPPTARREAGK